MSQSIVADLNNEFVLGIACDSTNNIYVNVGEFIAKISTDGTISPFVSSGLNFGVDLISDNLGNFYSADVISGNIFKISSNGTVTTFVSGLQNPTGLAIDSLGNIYASLLSGFSIVKITNNGSVSTLVEPGVIPGEITDITIDNLGNIYTISENSIYKITSDGTVSLFVPSTSFTGGTMIGICFDGTSDFYCADSNSIYKISSNGSVTIFSSIPSDIFLDESFIHFLVFDNLGNLYCTTNTGKIYKYAPVITPPISNICFPAGTPIKTDQGLIPIDKINTNIHTIRNNKIETITRTITQDSFLVCIEKDALGKNIPSEKTLISRNHRLFYNTKMITAFELLNKINNNETIYKVKYSGEVLYNILLDKHDKMVVNNLICETLNPLNGIAIMYSYMKKHNFTDKQKQEFINSYNKSVTQKKIFIHKK